MKKFLLCIIFICFPFCAVGMEYEDPDDGYIPFLRDIQLRNAIVREDLDAIKRLKDGGANEEVLIQKGLLPLHIAVRCDDEALCNRLIDAGADPFEKSKKGLIPLFYCNRDWVYRNKIDLSIMESMVQKDPIKARGAIAAHGTFGSYLQDQNIQKFLFETVDNGKIHLTKLLLEHVIDPARTIEFSLLHRAVTFSNAEMCDLLLSFAKGEKKRELVIEVLRDAFRRGKYRIVKMMLTEYRDEVIVCDHLLYYLLFNDFRHHGTIEILGENVDRIVELLIIRNQTILTFLLCLKHHPDFAMRELYRQKLVSRYLRLAYKPIKKLCERCCKNADPECTILPSLDSARVDETYERFLAPGREKFKEEMRLQEERERQRMQELAARQEAQRESLLARLGEQFENHTIDIMDEMDEVAVQKQCCVMQ